MEKERARFRWCRLLGVEAAGAVYVSFLFCGYILHNRLYEGLVGLLAAAYFFGVLVYGNGPPAHARNESGHSPTVLETFCWLVALIEVLVYSRIRYG
jgi:hypothetical protein